VKPLRTAAARDHRHASPHKRSPELRPRLPVVVDVLLCCLRSPPGSHHQRGGSVSDALLESGAVERGVAKLFRGKVTPFGSAGLRFTQSAVLAAISISGLKSLLEHTRLLTLGKAGEGRFRNGPLVAAMAAGALNHLATCKVTCTCLRGHASCSAAPQPKSRGLLLFSLFAVVRRYAAAAAGCVLPAAKAVESGRGPRRRAGGTAP
jgi:hypothetical protein